MLNMDWLKWVNDINQHVHSGSTILMWIWPFVFCKTIKTFGKILFYKERKVCIIMTTHHTLQTLFSNNLILHWNPFGLLGGPLVMFVWPFFPCLSPFPCPPPISWIDFPFVLDGRDTQCWFQLYVGCFIACSVFVYGGIPQFHSAHKEIPSGLASPGVRCFSATK